MSNVEALSRDEIRRRIGLAPADNQSSHPEWVTPKELPSKLAKVDDFSLEFLPPSVAPWVGDISDRLQCPPGLRCGYRTHRARVADRATYRYQTPTENGMARGA